MLTDLSDEEMLPIGDNSIGGIKADSLLFRILPSR